MSGLRAYKLLFPLVHMYLQFIIGFVSLVTLKDTEGYSRLQTVITGYGV